jgi:serine/threonine protein phosphatase PrpC
MRAIRDMSEIREASVLHHSAFGFARVVEVHPDRIQLKWEDGTPNLPSHVAADVLKRVYALCPNEGFFHRALHDGQALVEWMNTAPSDALELLLKDLSGLQREQDLRDWVVGRKLMSNDAFTKWWRMTAHVAGEDLRFTWGSESVSLAQEDVEEGPGARLRNPMLAPGRRLGLALEHREEIGDELFLSSALLSWRTGGTQVRDLALTTLKDFAPDVLISGLLSDDSESIEAVIHAIRRAGWSPSDLSAASHELLLERILLPCEDGRALEHEGRLAATLVRWNSPGINESLAQIVCTTDGKRLLRATFAALSPRHGEELCLELLESVLVEEDNATAQWLGGEALAFVLVDQHVMADRIDETFPVLADWFRYEFFGVHDDRGVPLWDDVTGDTAHTAEIDLSDVVDAPVPLKALPPRSGASLIGLGLALGRALAAHHKDGVIVNPSRDTVTVLPNETIEIEPSENAAASPRAVGETPSPCSDVYAGAVLLLEAMLGRTWPRNLPAFRAMPYLRNVVNLIPPSAIAPLEAALHPDMQLRPADGLAWLAIWQSAAVAEETRGYAQHSGGDRLQIGYDSHIGRMKVLLTQTNQDACFVSSKGPLSLLVVCDGISTANAGSGDVASSISAGVIANLWEQALPRLTTAGPGDMREFLDRALRMANTAVCDAALRFAGGNLDGRVPMGTTAVVAVVHGNLVSLAWLGDSRAYLVGPYGASILTADENQASERLRVWHLNFIDRWDPSGYALVGYLGHFNELTRPEALPAHHTSFMLCPGERLVICSDGVTDYMAETSPEAARLVSETARIENLDDMARALVAMANRGGGGDNATAVIASLW